ncbi:MAG: acetylornithine deacetylase [Gemmatimonadales bacterium]
MTTPLRNSALLSRLTAFDSTSRNSNLPIADFICEYVDRPGVRIARNPSPDGSKVNLVISIGPQDTGDRTGLILSGHMDVVPADEPEWESDPFVMSTTSHAYVGRGTCDMKGFLAIAINQLAAADPLKLRHPLVLLLTYDEELGTIGARHLAETWTEPNQLPRNAIVGEPTVLRVIRMHKGHLEFRVSIAGKSAHSGYPHLGENAIEPAGPLITALSELKRQLENESAPNREYFPEVPYTALNLSQIDGGTAINIVPDKCVLDCGIRMLPDMDSAEIIQRVRSVVCDAVTSDRCTFEVRGEAPPMLLPEDSEIYRTLCDKTTQSETLSASYATDAGWFQMMGIQSAIFGPGSIEVAHKPNESLPIDQFDSAAAIVADVVHDLCEADIP